MYRCYQLSGCP